ncbi:MAG: TlyA family RNA methyltransferase [Clostridiales bacterium]|jgi:23S rRNA (cytidine1920-2'-O)/16S rRNA (cytidine1409-2'-O)-methyltransferase|nr:TlyA family RNA methyltransferase [Clostridiales bacterium]
MKRERADRLVVSRGLAETREKAQALIMAGLVYAGGRPVEKPGQLVAADETLSIEKGLPYVSRGGLKLEEALDAWKISVSEKVAADLGSSTGGFTDCLLKRGASRVYAVDVSTSQLDWRLRHDPRVIPVEKNARYLSREDFSEKVDLATVDLSFISVLKVLPAVRGFLGEGLVLCLLKPQFEAGKRQVGKKGVISDPGRHEAVLGRVLEEAQKLGFGVAGLLKCSTRGQKGNREFFALFIPGGSPLPQEKIRALVREVVHEP